ncbi:MAG: phosphatidate cytidylyltransferase [Spirochaetaceae bacterium]|jgi:phosphatidate cytidylyltransferase|nr:phosphatidate cytidylyltransferase [Spirochaetaceae bacterium]
MKNIVERLIIFIIGLPALLAVVFLFPQKSHLALNICVIIFSVLGAIEFANILKKKNPGLNVAEAAVFGGLSPFAFTLYVSFNWTPFLAAAAVLLCASYCLIRCAFSPAQKLKDADLRVSAGFSVIFYPGLFLGCIILMSTFSDSVQAQTILIVTFLCIVMANDAMAWFFGILFGRKSKGIIAASPNKSLVGFIAGIASSVAVGILASLWQPEVFNAERFSSGVSGIVLGLTTGIASIVGDLAESALKRSSGVKDSGTLIPGRGGILDSIDSIALAAPVFFIVYNVLFNIK